MQIPEFKISLSMKKKVTELKVVKTSLDCFEVFKEVFEADTMEWIESFIVLSLNKANRVVGFYKISSGGMSGTVADPKVILQFALLSNSSQLVLAHNHPSGSLRPSRQDEALTHKIKSAANLFDIEILDHLIITQEGYYSFADEGIL